MSSVTSATTAAGAVKEAKTSAAELKVKEFDAVYLLGDLLKVAVDSKVPYPHDWFMVTNITGGEASKKTYCVAGSVSGKIGPIAWERRGMISYIRPW